MTAYKKKNSPTQNVRPNVPDAEEEEEAEEEVEDDDE